MNNLEPRPERGIEPPARPRYSELLRALKKGESILLRGAAPGSIKTILHRLRGEFENRRFTSAKDGNGIRVWRTA